ncbi:MAG: ABC transporter permease [Holosporales bacterium]|jgi:ABC-2 type transport system permease protein|nr:ABC transporter permease [Holosporales bacterium]
MNINTIRALIFKEVKQISRDISSILVAFVMPLSLLIISGYGLSFDIKHIAIDVVQQDSGKLARNLADAYIYSDYFKTNIVHSTEEAKQHMESGKIMGMIVIPENFSKNIKKKKKTEIQVIGDGTDPNTAAYVEGYATGIFGKYIESLVPSHSSGINVINRLWFNPTAKSVNFIMAGILTMILAIVGTFLTSLVVAREWERGTMEAMIATTVSIEEFIISKIIPYFCLCVVSLVFSILYGIFAFDMPFEGSIFAMSLVSSIFIVVSLLIGLIISTAAKDQFVAAMGAVTVTFLPTMMLSGFIFEIKSMPIWLQFFSYIFPARHYVSSVRTILLAGDVWPIILRDTAVLSTMTFALFLVLMKKLKKNIE